MLGFSSWGIWVLVFRVLGFSVNKALGFSFLGQGSGL